MLSKLLVMPVLAALAATFAWGAPATLAQTASQQAGPLRVAIVRTEVVNSRLGQNARPVENMADQMLVSLFERAGHETRLIDSPVASPAGWANDRQLAHASQPMGADWVVYPRILVIGGTPLLRPALADATAPETRAVIHVRVVNVRRPHALGTLYTRQVGHSWPREPAQVSAFGEAQGIPHGFAKAFQYFAPLNAALVARGQPSLETQPLAVAQTVWPAERVAGFRDTIRDP